MQAVALTLMGFLYVSVLFNGMTKLLYPLDGSDGRWLVIYMIIVVKFSDIGAYFVGCSIGKHKMIPRISPGKSWEGCIGGILTSVVASLLVVYFAKGAFGTVEISMTHALILGVVLSVSGILGDLAESLLKRSAAIKDSGSFIAGMGGLLDVVDSLLFAAPVMYIYVQFFL